jgi:hypothetical protein
MVEFRGPLVEMPPIPEPSGKVREAIRETMDTLEGKRSAPTSA